jgi:hypothetical protein
MNVEVDHRHSPEAMGGARMKGPNRDIVDQTEPHGACGFRMMSRRSHRAEGIADRPGRDRIHRRHHRAGGRDDRSPGAGRDDRVGIDARQAALRNGGQHRIDKGLGMGARHLRDRGIRRRHAGQPAKSRLIQGLHHRANAVRTFGMTGSGVMGCGMDRGDQKGRHEMRL